VSCIYVRYGVKIAAIFLQLSMSDDSCAIMLTWNMLFAVCCRAGADLILTYYSVEAAKWLAGEK
jgi:delta-aminolevulinic acid dehydratase/porphobilinogen synthase